MAEISFGTNVWRAMVAQEYTIENVARVAQATAQWLLKNNASSVVIGHDNRYGGRLFAKTTATILCSHGIKVHLAKGFVSTPMVSLGTVKLKADLGIVITSSHNPPAYNGFKLKGPYGGPLLPEKIAEIGTFIEDSSPEGFDKLEIEAFEKSGLLEYTDLKNMYYQHLEAHFDLKAIRNSKLNFVYDAMYGAGQNVVPRLLPNVAVLHCDSNTSFHGQAPEPIHRNLEEFYSLIKVCGNFDCGIATDGNSDRIGLYDGEGNFIDSNHVMLLLIKYLYEHKGLRGKVVTTFSVSPKIAKLCKHYGLEHQITKLGFKKIASVMVHEDVLIGGEESGGMAIKGHIPERDGIWIGFTIWEFLAVSGKTLQQILKEIDDVVGTFASDRSDLHMENDLKDFIIRNCEANKYLNFNEFRIQKIEKLDGYKYHFGKEEWLMIRASGTEPVIRLYGEAGSLQRTQAILKAAEETLLSKVPMPGEKSNLKKISNPNIYERYLEAFVDREDMKSV